mgnify:CR=1 FL=1
MSYLSGITNIHSLGTLNPYTSTKIRGNSQVVERILKQAAELQGLGDTEGRKIPFSDVVAKYNKGNCYILMLNNKLAKQNFEEANQYAKDINALSLQAFALKGLAQVYTLEGNYQLAIQTLNNAILLSSSVDDLILNQEIYKGQVVGENNRQDDMSINLTKGKKLTNVRSSGTDDSVKIAPKIDFSLEECMEYIKVDEYLEVTPESLRMRKISFRP